MNNWIYERNNDNTQRYSLGRKGIHPLVCIGVNPSTAEPDHLDNTLIRVQNRVYDLSYDSWIMLNLYPQRSTNPKELHVQMDPEAHKRNLAAIYLLLHKPAYDIWAAWGTIIESRGYLGTCLKDIVELAHPDSRWFAIGQRSKKGHPHHPLYVSRNAVPTVFEIRQYVHDMTSAT